MTIKLYSTPTCPWCSMTRKYFDTRNVQYQDIDVTKDRNAVEEMVAKSGQRGVPVIDIDGSIIIGFDKERVDSLI